MRYLRTKIALLTLTLLVAAIYVMTDTVGIKATIQTNNGHATAVHLAGNKGLYGLRVETFAGPDFQGDVDVNLEGVPGMNYSLYNASAPVFSDRTDQPELHAGLLHGLRTDTPLNLWVLMQPKPPAPTNITQQEELPPCCVSAGKLENSSLKTMSDWKKPLQLTFRDSSSHQILLSIPILVGEQPVSLPVKKNPTEDLNKLFVTTPAGNDE